MPTGMLQRSSEATREAPAGGGSGLQMEISSEATREVPAGRVVNRFGFGLIPNRFLPVSEKTLIG